MSQLSRVKSSESAQMRPVSARSHHRSLLAMEETMREEIRELQEQRAAAMMTEIVELQKERDLALGKVKRLEKKVKDMEGEISQLKKASTGSVVKSGEGKSDLLNLLRQALLEEQLLTSDLKRKLQTAKKQNAALSQRLQEAKSQPGSPDTIARRRSHSFDSRSASPLASPALTPQSDRKSSSFLKPPTPSTPMDSPSTRRAGFSPSVIPRRYKLAATVSREVGTQTDLPPPTPHSSLTSDTPTTKPPESTLTQTSQSDEPTAVLAPPIMEALSSARADILRLQGERNTAQRELAKEKEKRAVFKKESESLHLECGVLRDALSEFSRWTRSKLTTIEEDMDIFRVIYSLHGSLSQEQSALQELQDKLHRTEQRVLELELSNRHLTLAASEAEEKYQQSLTQTRSLQDKLSLLTPSPSHLSPSTTSHLRMRQFSSPQLPRHIPTSPLITHTPPHPTHDVV